jgi:hypothetical protein
MIEISLIHDFNQFYSSKSILYANKLDKGGIDNVSLHALNENCA